MPVTKPFLLATSGATVDGRTIDAKMLTEMATSYDPKTYGARLNIEHIRGITGESPFRAYGDVVSLSTGEVEVDFNGKKEKRTALYGVLDINADAEKLNKAGQKVYPSIEIEPNFAGKGFAYLMGCALTDSPAAIATDRLQFNRTRPGALNVAAEEAAALEFADVETIETATGLLASMKAMLDGFTAKFAAAPKVEEQKTDPKDPAPAAFDIGAFTTLIEGFGKTVATSIEGLRSEFRTEADRQALAIKKLEDAGERQVDPNFRHRPIADGAGQQFKAQF